MGAVVTLESTLLTKLALDAPNIATWGRPACLVLVSLALASQIPILFQLLRVGYRGHQLLGPESPAALANYVVNQDELETVRVIGAYYAKSHAHFHALSEKLGDEIGFLTTLFRWTILLVMVGILVLVIASLSPPTEAATITP